MLTKRNIQVLRTILHYAKHYHAWPSLNEIGERIGNISKQAVALHITALKAHGLVDFHRYGVESGQRITQQGYAFLKVAPITIDHNKPSRRIRARRGLLGLYTKSQRLAQRSQAVHLDSGITLFQP